jgi:hypothetical protein
MKQGRDALSAWMAAAEHNRFQLDKMNNPFDSRKPKFGTRLELRVQTDPRTHDG